MMKVDPEWSVREERGFTWWGKDFAQRVWAEPAFDDDGFLVSRVHSRTDLVSGFAASDGNLVKLATFNTMASLSGLVWQPGDPDRVRLAASMYVHQQTLDMVKRLFSIAVAMQAAEAQAKATTLAQALGAMPDPSPHPTSGPRPVSDDMLNIIRQVITPYGKGRSLWAGQEMEQAVERLQAPPCVSCAWAIRTA